MIQNFLEMSQKLMPQSHRASIWMKAQETSYMCLNVCVCVCLSGGGGGVDGKENILREGRIQDSSVVQTYWRTKREKIRTMENVFRSYFFPNMSPWASACKYEPSMKCKSNWKLFSTIRRSLYIQATCGCKIINTQRNHKEYNSEMMHSQETHLDPVRDWNQEFACEELGLLSHSQWCRFSYVLNFFGVSFMLFSLLWAFCFKCLCARY